MLLVLEVDGMVAASLREAGGKEEKEEKGEQKGGQVTRAGHSCVLSLSCFLAVALQMPIHLTRSIFNRVPQAFAGQGSEAGDTGADS